MKKKYIFLIFFVICFLGITGLVVSNKIQPFDDWIYKMIFQIRNDGWDFVMKSITKCANTIPIISAMILIFILLPKKEKIWLGISGASMIAVNTIIKSIIQRARPDHLRLVKQGGYSYPSGHAMMAIAIYGFLISYLASSKLEKKQKIIFITFFTVLILGIGISRIYVGVHYPSDVIAGFCLGIAMEIGMISIRGYQNDKNGSK